MTSILGDHTRKPDITFHRSGLIDITAAVVKALGIENGDSLDIIANDFECAVTCIHHSVKGQFQAVCRPSKIGYHNMRCHSKKLTDFICDRFGADKVRLTTGMCIHRTDGSTAITLINRML